MPRLRCHWALLIASRDAFRDAMPAAYALVTTHRGEYFAGGVAPDALRIFLRADKASTHFYDDTREDTWGHVVAEIKQAHPDVAAPAALPPQTLAWMVGYLTHVHTDVAYWRHVLRHLPRFPERTDLHSGAWTLADCLPIPPEERWIDEDAIRYDLAPSWIDAGAVRQMLHRLAGRLLVPDGPVNVELAYFRNRSEARELSDAQILAAYETEWERNVAAVQTVVPPGAWVAFRQDAVSGAVDAVRSYLAG